MTQPDQTSHPAEQAQTEAHHVLTDFDGNTWCHEDCPRPDAECAARDSDLTPGLVTLTEDEQELIENAWIIAPKEGPQGDEDPMYRAVEHILADRLAEQAAQEVRRALHNAWLAIHVRRFDGDYDSNGRDVPEYAVQVTPDTIYNGTRRAEAAITAVAESYGIGWHALRDLSLPSAESGSER